MRAAIYFEYGDPSVLTVGEVEVPRAGPGQVRIRVAATSVNPVDWKFRTGQMARYIPLTFPAVPGSDAAGVVDEVGPGVSGVAVGDRVFGLTPLAGGAAEYAVLSHWASIPATMSTEQAAGAGFAGTVGIRALDLTGLSAGDTLLIEGAAGGIGSIVVQVALARGLTVIGTASEGNVDYLASLGALATRYGEGLTERVRELAPQGIDAVIDMAGSGSLAELIALAPSPDKVVSLVDFSAPAVGAVLVDGRSGDPNAALAELAALAADGRLAVTVRETFPLDAIARAHEMSERGHGRGKLVVVL